jgi:hypothetical protein
MKKGLAVGVGVLAASVLFSGCFFMRSLSYTKDKIAPGERTTARVSLHGDTAKDPETPFFLLFAEGGMKLAKGGKFDTTGAFSGPVRLVRDNALSGAAQDSCGNIVARKLRSRRGLGLMTAVRTREPFAATNGRKIIQAKLPMRATGDAFNAVGMVLAAGGWIDDGDGVPEDPEGSDDLFQCGPPYTTSLLIKGGTPPPP